MCFIDTSGSDGSNLFLVSSPDLIRHVYRFQYNARDTESDPRWGLVLGLGPRLVFSSGLERHYGGSNTLASFPGLTSTQSF